MVSFPHPEIGFIQWSSTANLEKYDAQSKLLLVVFVQTSFGCQSNWTVVDMAASAHSIASGVVFIPANEYSIVYIQLPPYTLVVSKSYLFTFRCERMTTVISIFPNSPPRNGIFTVSPPSGFEITTWFRFAANGWMDEDLPLEYQFGYTSFGNKNFLQVKSEEVMISSILPSGLEKHFTNATLEIFDALSTSTFRNVGVNLKPTDAATTVSYIESVASSSMSSSDINIVGSILNSVNCSGVTNCDIVNRRACFDVDFSCGPCQEGFLGESGSKNSICIQSTLQSTSSEIVRACKSDSECGNFQYCSSLGSCAKMSKQCPNSCSRQGVCNFINSNTDLLVSQCDMPSTDCQAVCQCFLGFGEPSK